MSNSDLFLKRISHKFNREIKVADVFLINRSGVKFLIKIWRVGRGEYTIQINTHHYPEIIAGVKKARKVAKDTAYSIKYFMDVPPYPANGEKYDKLLPTLKSGENSFNFLLS